MGEKMFCIINNNRPIYEQIREKFIELIINNALREGDKLPSVRELASMLTVNPNTISKAYNKLEDEGMIETLKGKGTFVRVGAKELVLAYNYEMLMNKIKDVLESAKNLNIKFNALVDLEKQVLNKLEGKSVIEIKDLTLKLEDKDILKNINLSIDEGKIYGLIGPNGVGKTSLIKCLTGVYKITTGEILYDGSNVYDNAEVKKNIAYVADENNFFTSFLVRDVIKYYKLAYDNFNEEKFHKINKVFKIPLNKRLHQLSKGMKMRTFLMLGFAQEAKYIILD